MFSCLHILEYLSSTICSVFDLNSNQDIVNSVLCGFLEITRGIIELNYTNVTINLKVILSSTLIGFGGFSIFFQSLHFLEKLKIKKKFILLQKLTQALLCLLISTLLCITFI